MYETVERYSATGTFLAGPYLSEPIGLPVFHDISYLNGDIWYACDNSDYPVKAFDTSGALTNSISNSVIPAAHGLCFEDEQYLWASNYYTDELYRINLNPTGIEEEDAQNVISLASIGNPFSDLITIQGTGFSEAAVLEIYDVMGRKVYTVSFNGSHTWAGKDNNGNLVPSGTYTVFISDGLSGRVSLKVLRM